jgi:hypothetical protein
MGCEGDMPIVWRRDKENSPGCDARREGGFGWWLLGGMACW